MKKGTSYPLFTRAGICRRHMSVTFVGDKQYLSAVYQSKHAEWARSIAAPSEFFLELEYSIAALRRVLNETGS